MHDEMINKDFDNALAAKILGDAAISEWFFNVCIGRKPKVRISAKIAKEMERQKFVIKTASGLKLGLAGEEFARKLGLLIGKEQTDLIHGLLDHMSGRTSKGSRKNKKKPSKGNKENK